ncbi:transcription antitermination factor NusB [Leifsonia sp. H3M29-4]|uniref:RsmB/NOP family class I SAM-dependent RNA methyltransferase n=1 Tax=Salinibacterium metalliresistens TaxID=3031321 RepID=UPI0023DB8F5C|nr:transcription antitermination factor NusB [Salinibacterium metalliresistens]MDF1479825.1 transcription antitermination factor NusB [Salinibacterium metalliresistens]
MSVQPARRIALDVILAVRDSDAYANLLLPVRLGRAKLSDADAGLATELTYGTLRMQGYYDRVIALAANRPVEQIDAPVLDVLRLACHQILSMRIPAHAAVDESVELVRSVASRSAVGFANGVLRTITRTDADTWRERVLATAGSGEERLAIEYSHPLWVTRAFRQVLVAEGREAELEPLLVADNVAPRVSLTALPGFAAPEGYTTEFSPVGMVLDGGDPLRIPGVREGRVRVQDEGSALAALALSRARPIVPGERWLDLCAGPGGKAALLAAEAAIGGATLTANELVPARAELVRKALAVFDAPPEVLESDGTTIGERFPAAFDRILLDAPCTGLGALRRRPEARWRKQPSDVAGLGALQAKLLGSALDALKPGGVLAYVTCSPHAAETKAIVASTLRTRTDVERLDTPAVLQSIVKTPLDLPEASHVQLWPHRHGTDAMFIQLLTKVEA